MIDNLPISFNCAGSFHRTVSFIEITNKSHIAVNRYCYDTLILLTQATDVRYKEYGHSEFY